MNTDRTTQTRIAYLDMLRILACMFVVTVHVSAMQIDTLPLRSSAYFITNAFNCLGFLGVTLFVMISGSLMLGADKADGIRKPVRGSLRFFALYYVWKALYQMLDLVGSQTPLTFAAFKNDVLLALIRQRGYYHLWFLPMLAILYLTVPVIKKSVSERKICEYFLCIFFVAGLLFPTLFHYEFKFKYLFVDFFTSNDFSFFCGYLGYFILGHYLSRFLSGANGFFCKALYILGAASLALSCVLGFRYSIAKESISYVMNTPLTPMMFFTACAVFVACKRLDMRLWVHPRAGTALCSFAKLTLGIYLLHPAVLVLAQKIGFVPSICSPLLSIPLIVVCVAVLCGAISFVLLKIPVLCRLIR